MRHRHAAYSISGQITLRHGPIKLEERGSHASCLPDALVIEVCGFPTGLLSAIMPDDAMEVRTGVRFLL